MSKLGLVVLLSFLSGRTLSQDYFVFIGSDHRQPFYVRIDSQVYSSSEEGHLLVAPLKDSDYILTIGFPGQTWPEKQYGFSIHGKDREFELRRQEDGSWRLYDDVGKDWVTALEKESGPEVAMAGVKKDDAFSRMMAGVVHDTAVLYNTYAMEEALKDSPVAKGGADSASLGARVTVDSSMKVVRVTVDSSKKMSRIAVDSSKKASRIAVDSSKKMGRVAPDSPVALRSDSARVDSAASGASTVVKVSEKKSSRAVRLVYADNKDTIVVIIPRDTQAAAEASRVHPADTMRKAAVETTRKVAVDTARKAVVETTRKVAVDTARKAVVDTARKTSMDTIRKAAVDTTRKTAMGIAYINSDCHNFATDYDVDRLRVKMLDAARDEDRLAAARKVFKTKCFYTPQIRALSEVFTSDEGKFRFFEAAWPFAADEHFRELSVLLSDPVYIGKFRTMTGMQP